MLATTIRMRGNAWQVRVGSGKAQHSIGSFKTYEEALKASESAKSKSLNTKASNYSAKIINLAKQMAEEAVRERKEWIEEFLIESSSSSEDLFSLAPKISAMAKQEFEGVAVISDNQCFDINTFRSADTSKREMAISTIAKLPDADRLKLYKSYYESATDSDTDFEEWHSNLSEDDLTKLDCWLFLNWKIFAK